MKNKIINFSKNWNDKLNNKEFTSIRQDRGYWQTGVSESVSVYLRKNYLGDAVLLKVESISVQDITEELAQSDAGLSKADLILMLERMYGRDPKLQILYFKWQQKKVIECQR